MSLLVRGRPARFGYVHLRVIRRRCQAKKRARRDEPAGAQHGWQVPDQCRQDGTIGPVRRGPGDLTAKHRDLMTQDHDLRVFWTLAATQQHQPSEDPDRDQVEQAKGHKPRSCRNQFIRPNRRLHHLRRVLKRYRVGLVEIEARKPSEDVWLRLLPGLLPCAVVVGSRCVETCLRLLSGRRVDGQTCCLGRVEQPLVVSHERGQ
jgi:hypothetical protein